jgi:hypothetical protein
LVLDGRELWMADNGRGTLLHVDPQVRKCPHGVAFVRLQTAEKSAVLESASEVGDRNIRTKQPGALGRRLTE